MAKCFMREMLPLKGIRLFVQHDDGSNPRVSQTPLVCRAWQTRKVEMPNVAKGQDRHARSLCGKR